MKKKKIDLSNMSALLVLIVLCILLSIAEPAFHSFANFINILQQVTVIAVLALGVNIVIFTGYPAFLDFFIRATAPNSFLSNTILWTT